jgi:transcriptional regulator with PAS, ATPase and Fis domain
VLRPGDVLAAYAPLVYELLLIDTARPQADAFADELGVALEAKGIASRRGLAFYPGDGASPQALMTRACALVRGADDNAPPGVVVASRAMTELHELAARVAAGTINVLIVGETGVGKEVLAETVHRLSPRNGKAFVTVNCAALSESLLESELFGYEKGAFTGANQAKEGLLEAAAGGTLFLDEVGEMPLALQAKLLRAIETRQILRVGATRPRSIDVRFLAATNRDLEEEVAAKRFRQDLFFRLDGVTLAIPPLRERLDELEPLATTFIQAAARQLGREPPPLAPAALDLFRSYAWPGNIRELRNVLERGVLLAGTGPIDLGELPMERMLRRFPEAAPAPEPSAGTPRLTIREVEKQAILDALAACGGNQTRAAELLGMPRRTFCTRLKDYNIPRPKLRGG